MPTMILILRWLDRKSPGLICMIGALLIGSIGVLSYLTGPQFSSSLFYLIPILLVTRVAGFLPGAVTALLAASIWLFADLDAGLVYGYSVTPYWNALMRLGTFLVAVSLVSAMRSLNAHLEKRVHERTAALETQIAEKRELEKAILEISDRERAAIGQDLHDGLCQQLVSAAFSANMLQESLTKTAAPNTKDASRISDMLDDAITQARNLARGLYPVRLETEGLEMALRELASTMSRRFEIACAVDCPAPLKACIPTAGIHLYRIAQEAVVNAARHANARNVILRLTVQDGRVRLVIEDDGIGTSGASHNPDGMGLRIMEYRARMIGADFTVDSVPHCGTKVICELDETSFRA